MKQEEIGRFISQMRKEKDMTQKQLAEKIGVSDKAISRWETGKGLPDTATMPDLCEALGINVNELLSGQRLSDVAYSGKAEENMVYLMKVSEDKRNSERQKNICVGLGGVLIVLLLLYMIISVGGTRAIMNYIDFPSILVVLVGGGLVLGVGGEMKPFLKAFGYAFRSLKEEEIEVFKGNGELQKSYFAVRYAMKAVLLIGAIGFCTGIVGALHSMSTPQSIGPALAVAILSLFYSVLIDLFLLPVKSWLHKKML